MGFSDFFAILGCDARL